VFAVGDNGTILHYDGTDWSAQSSGTTAQLFDVWGSSATDVYAVGRGGNGMLHFDGTSWSSVSGIPQSSLFGIWGASAHDVFAVGQKTMSVAVLILRYDGRSWSAETLAAGPAFSGVWGSSSTNVIATGTNAGVWRYNGSGWANEYPGGDILFVLEGVWGTSASDVFVVGWVMDGFGGATTMILRYDGARWVAMSNVGIANLALADVWGTADDVFAVGSLSIGDDGQLHGTTIIHYDGRRWGREPFDTRPLTGVWGTGDDVFAVGYSGLIVRGSR